MRVVIIPVLMDNYAYLVIDETTNEAAIVDPAEAEPVLSAAAREKVKLTAVLNTHHHYDHTGGNLDLLARRPDLRIIGSRADSAKIPGITEPVDSGERVRIG